MDLSIFYFSLCFYPIQSNQSNLIVLSYLSLYLSLYLYLSISLSLYIYLSMVYLDLLFTSWVSSGKYFSFRNHSQKFRHYHMQGNLEVGAMNSK